MTIELKEALDAEMDAAMESGDQERINIAQLHYNKAMADCQFKTATRVKDIARDVPEIKEDVKEVKSIVERGKKAFRTVAWSAVKWIVAGGAGAEFARYLITNGGAQ